jgi:hypothetical protein
MSARSITFPGVFLDALDFSLKNSAFAIHDLPGELDDEERLLLIGRLIQEGVIVRRHETSQ